MSELAVPGTAVRGPGLARALSDERLVARAAGGDERAFAAIFDRYHQRLYRYCLAIVGRPEDAQDALQNAMLKVLRALPGEERQIELKPWLYRIAHNESIDLLRRRRDAPELDAELAAPGAGLAEEAVTRERLARLLEDVQSLPERQRGALVMRELAGLEFAQIGAALGTTAAVARQTLYEARLGLREMGEGREMGCDAVTQALSGGDGRVARRRDIRAHLRVCSECRRFGEEIEGRRREFAALAPLPAVAAAGLLQSLLGGAGGGGGGGLSAAFGGAAKALGGSTLLKGAATVAVVAAVGVGAADRGGLIELGSDGRPSSPPPAAARDASRPGASPASATSAADDAGATAGATPVAGTAGIAVDAARAHDAAGRDAGTQDAANAAPGPDEVPASNPTEPAANAAAPANADGPASAAAPAHGKGHEKQHPAAAEHGLQTAATHKATGNGAAAAPGSNGGGNGKGKSGAAHGANGKEAGGANGKGAGGNPAKPAPPSQAAGSGTGKGKPSTAAAAVPATQEEAPAAPLPEPSDAPDEVTGTGPHK